MRDKAKQRMVVPLRSSQESGQPYFSVSGLGGHVITFQIIAKSVSDAWRGYGLLYPGFHGEALVSPTVESFAESMLKHVKEVQASGPYLFVGYSLGGNVCLEMARLLRAEGEKVGVVLADVKIYKHAKKKPLLKRLPVKLFWRARGYLAKYSGLSRRHTNQLRRAMMVEGYDLGLAMPESLARVFRDGRKASDEYVPRPCDVFVVLLRCKDYIWFDDIYAWEEDYAWGRYVKLLKVAYVTGNHLTMMNPPNTQAFAESLDDAYRILLEAMEK